MTLAREARLSVCGLTASSEPVRRSHVRPDYETGLPKLSAAARHAPSAAGYTRLDQLAQVPESDLKELHGMGPTAIAALRAALAEQGLSFGCRGEEPGWQS
jgi:hypothetical protein